MKRRPGFCVMVLIAVLTIVLVLPSACGGGKPAITPVEATKMTHQLKGFEDCISCHATGTGGGKAYPADVNHSGRSNKDCNLCHKPK